MLQKLTRYNQWKAAERSRAGYYRRAEYDFYNALMAQLKPVVDYARQYGIDFDINIALEKIKSDPVFEKFVYTYQSAGVDFASKQYMLYEADRIGEAMKQQWMTFFQNYVKTNCAERVTSITNVTKEYARRIISNTIAENSDLGTDKLGMLIEKELVKQGAIMSTWRARVISRTEVVSASNIGNQVGAEALGVEMKKTWLATMDDRVRDAHFQMNGVSVGLQDSFTVGTDQMYTPGDPTASAENTVNCRCTCYYTVL